MKFYIVDDDMNVVKVLKNIIEDRKLGKVIGMAYDGQAALKDIKAYGPDIVLIDYLMPYKDGASVVKQLKETQEHIYFIIISQVSDEEMVAEAYEAGIEFFISKPINIIEVEKIISALAQKIEMTQTLSRIKGMLQGGEQKISTNNHRSQQRITRIKLILSHISILGKKGSYDIIEVCKILLQRDGDAIGHLDDVIAGLEDKPKIVKQRMRRAIYHGLTNIANIGIEDYMNDYFVRYSSTLYDFEQVKAEMDFIRGKGQYKGKVNLYKFMDNLLIQSEILQS